MCVQKIARAFFFSLSSKVFSAEQQQKPKMKSKKTTQWHKMIKHLNTQEISLFHGNSNKKLCINMMILHEMYQIDVCMTTRQDRRCVVSFFFVAILVLSAVRLYTTVQMHIYPMQSHQLRDKMRKKKLAIEWVR